MVKCFRHFKGGLYKFIGIAKDSETQEEMVVYQALYGDGQLWVRPKEMFLGEVERDGNRIPRFQELDENEVEDSNHLFIEAGLTPKPMRPPQNCLS